jgi:G:T-mismatch repair DNA endonuclease (very short patch repair protein)
MHEAFLAKYGSFLELAKMGLKAPKRRPNKLELEVAKFLGDEWKYVGKGELVVGGLIPDFVHRAKREVLEVLGCYFHGCPQHFPDVRMERTASTGYKESIYKKHGYEVTFLWEHDIKRRKIAFRDAGVKDPSAYAE